MDACWGIPPSANGGIPNLNFGRISDDAFQQAMAEVLNNSDCPQPPATPVVVPATYFPGASGANNHTTSGGHPLGSSGGAYGGFGFTTPENRHTSQTSPSAPYSFPLASEPFASAPPEVHGCSTTWCNGVAPPKASPTAPAAVFATANPGVLNGKLSGTSPSCYGHGSPVTCGPPYDFVFGEESNQAGVPSRHDSGFQYVLPSGQAPQPFPGHSNQAIPTPTFAPASAQYALPSRREFVHGSATSALSPMHLTPFVLAAHPSTSTPYSLASGYDANPIHVPAPFLPSPPSFISSGYASTAYAHGGTPAPGGSIAVPPALPPILGKRKGEPTRLRAPTAKAAKLSAHASPSRQPPLPVEPDTTEEAKENRFPAPSSVPPSTFNKLASEPSPPRTRLLWGIDWSKPQTWAGEAIAAHPGSYKAVLGALSKTHAFVWDELLRCRWNGCTKAYARTGAMKSHVLGRAHLDVRRECLRCGYSVRPDNFKTRHTPAWCDRTLGRREERARRKAEKARKKEEKAEEGRKR